MTDELRVKVLKIMELAMLLNPTETKREVTGDKPTVFVEFSGHICGMSISVNYTGWFQVLNDTLEAIGADEKINSYCIVLRQLKADEEANKAEKKRFEGRIKMYANGQKRMKKALEDFLTATGKDKAKTDKFTLYHTTSKAVEVTDINAIPDEYIKPRREDDVMKSEIAKAIKDGKEIPGAVLVTNQPLVIR